MTLEAPQAEPSHRSRRPSRRTVLRAGIPAAIAAAGAGAWIGTAAWADGPTDTELALELTDRIKTYVGTTGLDLTVSVAAARNNRTITANWRRIQDTASLVKMEILLMTLEKYASVSAIPAEKKEWARTMITESHNDNATKLYNFLGGCSALSAAHVRYGLKNTKASADCRWGLTTTTATDQLRVLNHLMLPGILNQEKINYARSLMGNVVDSQDWGVTAAAGASDTVWLKNGWDTRTSLGGLWVAHSVGYISIPNKHDVRMAILTSRTPNYAKGVQVVEEVAKLTRTVIMKAVV
ncbi:serine hydrolase [Glycomyces endophyticus]|uniref:Beta-lactamase n=1 Tax=Glycomyces endophyticus TaxID=480996 RepID=A0ABP4TGU9_9ACTN